MHEIVEQELEDFNEEEDYVKFMQKENMSPMIPKVKPDQKKLPIPVVTCEWSDKKKSASSLTSSYIPGLGMFFKNQDTILHLFYHKQFDSCLEYQI